MPQRPWDGPLPPEVESGQWRQMALAGDRPIEHMFCRVGRLDRPMGFAWHGEPVYQVEVYNFEVLMRDARHITLRGIAEQYPILLPGRPEKCEPYRPPPAETEAPRPRRVSAAAALFALAAVGAPPTRSR